MIGIGIGIPFDLRPPVISVFAGAAAAYSMRIPAGSAYNGPLIRVRRSTDNAEQNFGAAAVDANGNRRLDTTALLAFVGAGSGFVTTWYDQSGNGFHATQTTGANQPTIVSSGTVVTLSGRPSILAPLAAQWMTITTGTLLGVNGQVLPGNWVSLVGRADGAVSHSFISNDKPGLFGHGLGATTGGAISVMSNRFFSTGAANTLPFSTLLVASMDWSTTAGNIGNVNGTQVLTTVNDSGNGGGSSTYLFDFQPNSRGAAVPVYLSEVVIGKAARVTASRRALERSQGAAFGITVA